MTDKPKRPADYRAEWGPADPPPCTPRSVQIIRFGELEYGRFLFDWKRAFFANGVQVHEPSGRPYAPFHKRYNYTVWLVGVTAWRDIPPPQE